MFKRILFFLGLLVSTTLQATSSQLSPAIQATVDHYASPAVYNAFIEKGATHAAHFTNPAFIDRFVNFEEQRKEAYLTWYNTPCFTQKAGSRFALHKGDLAFAGFGSAGWGLEYFLFTRMHQFFIKAYYEELQNTDAWNPNFLASKQRQNWTQLVCLAAIITLASTAFTHTTKYVHFDTWLADQHPVPGMVHTFAGNVKYQLLQVINPQTWFDTCTSWLDYFGCIPDWSKTNTTAFSKALICNLTCMVWYEYNVLRPQWLTHYTNLQLAKTDIKEIFSTPELQRTFVAEGLEPSFFMWLQTKCYVTAFCNTCISGTIALIGAANAYKKIQPILEESSCSNAA